MRIFNFNFYRFFSPLLALHTHSFGDCNRQLIGSRSQTTNNYVERERPTKVHIRSIATANCILITIFLIPSYRTTSWCLDCGDAWNRFVVESKSCANATRTIEIGRTIRLLLLNFIIQKPKQSQDEQTNQLRSDVLMQNGINKKHVDVFCSVCDLLCLPGHAHCL